MDETRTRGPRADEPHPELPESLAWLYEPPPDERSRRRRSYAPGPPPTDIDPGAPRDPEALPTLLPFSAPPEEPPPAAHRGPVRGLRRAFARFDESRTDTSFRRPDAEEHDAERRAGGTTDWTTPVARPFAPPAHHGDDAHASEPDAQHDDDRYEEPLEAPAPDRSVPDEPMAGVWAPDASVPEASVPDEPGEPEGSVPEPVDRGSREEPVGDLPADETRLEDLGTEERYEPQDERLEEPAEDASDEPTGDVIGVGGDEPVHDQSAEPPSESPWPRAWHDRAPTAVHHDRELNLFEPVPLDVPAEPPADPEPLPSWNRLVAWPSPDADDVAPAESSAHVTEQPPAGDDHRSLEPAADPDRPPLPIRPRLATLVNRPAPLTDLPGTTVPASAVGSAVQPDGVHDDSQAQDDAPDAPDAEDAPGAEAEDAAPAMPEPRPRLSGLLRRPAVDTPEPPPSDARTVDLRDPVPDVAIVDTPDTPDSAEVQAGEDAPDPRAEAAQRFAIPPRPDLADPALTPLWVAVRDALQGGSRHDAPAVDVRGLDQSGRRALAGLLGVPTVRAATRVDLALLERIVAVTAGLPLAIAAERFVPAAGRRARAQSRTAPVRAAQEWLDAHPRLAALPWTATWLETVRRDVVGGDGGLTDTEVLAALELLGALTAADTATGAGTAWRVRSELAAEVAGDEHALDEGSAVAGLVLRGLAAAAGTGVPTEAAARRRLWARFGVLVDLVSTTCLALGVVPAEPGSGRRWRLAAEAGLPVHVTARDVREAGPDWAALPGGSPDILVVGNARVLEAVAERFGGTVAVVHADGGLDPLALDLLQRLHAGGARLRFLTDFDQPGICLGSELVERFDASPWRMSVEIYQASVRSDLPPLGGRVGDVPWAPGLAAAMNQAGRAVPVEQLLDDVLAELDGDLTEQPVAAE